MLGDGGVAKFQLCGVGGEVVFIILITKGSRHTRFNCGGYEDGKNYNYQGYRTKTNVQKYCMHSKKCFITSNILLVVLTRKVQGNQQALFI